MFIAFCQNQIHVMYLLQQRFRCHGPVFQNSRMGAIGQDCDVRSGARHAPAILSYPIHFKLMSIVLHDTYTQPAFL